MKRYYCTDSGSTYESYGEPIMKESDQGDYVKYDDVQKLVNADLVLAGEASENCVAEVSVAMADALIKALNEGEGNG